jgi:hypothetical protein
MTGKAAIGMVREIARTGREYAVKSRSHRRRRALNKKIASLRVVPLRIH